MAHTRGPAHLSVEDKTFPSKEWPKGYYSEIPSAPHGMTAAPGRLNEIYHQQETRCPVLGRPRQQSYLLFLPDLFPKHLSDTYFPYWALFLFSFLSLSFIPPLCYTLYLSLQLLLIFPGSAAPIISYTWKPFIFFQFSKELSQLAPSVFPKWPSAL